jgi:hypothetical protein
MYIFCKRPMGKKPAIFAYLPTCYAYFDLANRLAEYKAKYNDDGNGGYCDIFD